MRKSDVKKHFGSSSSIAKALGLTRQAISMWPERVPEGAAYKLQMITGGKLQVDASMYAKRDTA
jgi:transcriptional repressor of cell division inhibition gene dicB